ncbi:MAG TPA: hypothetical protein PLX34_21115 [Sedimentisphaerales bacterium]|jgi:hypothetical protein|nr:hypothetical protein [Sedimentisphaerales bacterium]
MAEWSMTDIMSQTNGFCQILIQPETSGYSARGGRHEAHMIHPRAHVVILRKIEDLGLVSQASKRLGVDDPVDVSLKIRSEVVLVL